MLKARELSLKIIAAEKRLQFNNEAVLGGFNEFFLKAFANGNYPENKYLQDGLRNYQSLKIKERKKLIETLEDLICEEQNESLELHILQGVGPKRTKSLMKLGIFNLLDLINYYPRRYEDRTVIFEIQKLEHNAQATILGQISRTKTTKLKPKLSILKVELLCCGKLIHAIFFNQLFLEQSFKPGRYLLVTGRISFDFGLRIIASDYELFLEKPILDQKSNLVPIYSLTNDLNQKFIRKIILDAFQKVESLIKDPMPKSIREENILLPLDKAIRIMHFPTNWDDLRRARYTLVFHELLILQIGVKFSGQLIKKQEGIKHRRNKLLFAQFLKKLSFPLTNAQLRVIKEIDNDMESQQLMFRLLQGDVGSGKTIIAIWALVKAASGGYQGALMVPTEILAGQHYYSLQGLMASLNLKVVLLTGSQSRKEKETNLHKVIIGEAQIIVGTHALISEQVKFNNLGIIIVDEQHRFGVKQRLALQDKGVKPDILVMTATPIPRTLALSIYGDMDISIIDELPPGRKKVKTYHFVENNLKPIYNLITREIRKGRQAYIVCPLVEESEKLDLVNVTETARNLAGEVFPNYNLGLIHGQIKKDEQELVMNEFREGKIDILVATTVVEVGVNIPNAAIMVILNAERFGLAQLHQLRGRVGRGEVESYCFLVSDAKTKEAKARMRIMTESNDGFRIAEEDLVIRGPGDIFGFKQHGIPELKVADLIKDIKVMEKTKKIADKIIEVGLEKKEYQKLYNEIKKRFQKTDVLKKD